MEEWKRWYMAGLWDGDGSFGVSKHYRGNQFKTGKKWTVYQPFAIITLVDPKAEKIFNLLESEFGFRCVWKGNRYNPKWKIAFKWELVSQQACDFARAIEPFLIIKKERARILMDWPKKKRGHKNLMTDEERERVTQRQEELYQQMKLLNKRGNE